MSFHGENTEAEEGRKLKRDARKNDGVARRNDDTGLDPRGGRVWTSLTVAKKLVFPLTFRPFCSMNLCIFQEELLCPSYSTRK